MKKLGVAMAFAFAMQGVSVLNGMSDMNQVYAPRIVDARKMRNQTEVTKMIDARKPTVVDARKSRMINATKPQMIDASDEAQAYRAAEQRFVKAKSQFRDAQQVFQNDPDSREAMRELNQSSRALRRAAARLQEVRNRWINSQ